MTEQQLAEIEARAEAATKGEWQVRGCAIQQVNGPLLVVDNSQGRFADLAFMAAARQDVPLLVAEVRRLQQQIDALMEALDVARSDMEVVWMCATGGSPPQQVHAAFTSAQQAINEALRAAQNGEAKSE